MTILYNNQNVDLPFEPMSLEQLAEWKEIPKQGAALALNDKLVKRELWPVTYLNPLDKVVVITAAFGG